MLFRSVSQSRYEGDGKLWEEVQQNAEYLAELGITMEKTKRKDILDRLQVFKDLSAEDLKQAKIANEKLQIDMHRCKGLYGDKDDATIYGWIMEVANDMTSMVGKIFSGTSNFSPSKTTNVNHHYGK